MLPSIIRGLNSRAGSIINNSRILCASGTNGQQSRSITGKKFRDKSVKKPAPWPYKEKKYTYFHAHFVNTEPYFDENTRVIVVDGNIGCGKTEFAKKLAEELEMKHFPEPSVDSLYVDQYGFDYRALDEHLPKVLRSFDLKKFYADPHNDLSCRFQLLMFLLRVEQYCDALAHMLNTGDGIVLERSVFSDFVFVEAMYKMGYVDQKFRSYYNEAKTYVMPEMVKPHLVIYLDAPVDVLLQRIKQRNNPIEVNSKVICEEYLNTIDHHYKQQFLKDIEKHSELLVYDWSNFGDIDAVVEDLERINFDKYDRYDLKMRDWRDSDRWYWNNLRRKYTNHKREILLNLFLPNSYEVKGFYSNHDENEAAATILDQVPNYRYAAGINPEMGESYLFKTSAGSYWDRQKYRIF